MRDKKSKKYVKIEDGLRKYLMSSKEFISIDEAIKEFDKKYGKIKGKNKQKALKTADFSTRYENTKINFEN